MPSKSKNAGDHMASTIDHIAQAADMLLQEDNSFMAERGVWTKRLSKLQTQNASLREKAAGSKVRVDSMKKEIIHVSNEVEILDGDLRMIRSEKAGLESDLGKARELITTLKNSVEIHEEKENRESDAFKSTLSRLENKLSKAQTVIASRNSALTDANHTIAHLNDDRVRIMNEHQRELEAMESNHSQELQLLSEKHHALMLEHAETHRVDLILANERTSAIISTAEEKDKRLREEHDRLVSNLHEEHHSTKHTIASEVFDKRELASNQIKELEEMLSISNTECEALQTRLTKLEFEVKQSQEKHSKTTELMMEENVDALKSMKEEAEVKLSKRESDHSIMSKRLSERVEELENLSSKLKNELLSSKLNISAMESRETELIDEKDGHERKKLKLEEELKRVKTSSRQELESKSEILEDVSSKLSTLEVEHRAKVQEANKSKHRLKKLDSEYETLTVDYETISDKLVSVEKELKESKSVLKTQQENITTAEEKTVKMESFVENMKSELSEVKIDKETFRAQADSSQLSLQTAQLSLQSVKDDYEKMRQQLKENSQRAEETQSILRSEANQSQSTLEGWLNKAKQEVLISKKALEQEKAISTSLQKEMKTLTVTSNKRELEVRNKQVLSLLRFKSHQLKVFAMKNWKLLTVTEVVKTDHEEKLLKTVNELRRDRESHEFNMKLKYDEEVRVIKAENSQSIESYELQLLDLRNKAKREFALHSHEVSQDSARVEGMRVSDQLEFLEARHALENEVHHVRGLFLVLIAKRRRHRLVLKGWKMLCLNSVATLVTSTLGESHRTLMQRTSDTHSNTIRDIKSASVECKREHKLHIDQLEKELCETSSELERANFDLAKLKRKLEDMRHRYDNEVSSLSSELDEVKDGRDAIQVSLGEVTRTKNVLKSDYDDAQRVLNTIRKKNNENELKLRDTSEELESTNITCGNLRDTVEKLTIKTKTILTSLEHSHIVTREVRSDLETTLSEKEEIEHELVNAQVKVKNLENVKIRLQKLNDELQSDVESHEKMESGLRRELRRLETRHSELTCDMKECRKKLEESEELVSESDAKYTVLERKFKETSGCLFDEKESHKITIDELTLSNKKYNDKVKSYINLKETLEKRGETHSMLMLFTVIKRLYLRKIAVAWCKWKVHSECCDVEKTVRKVLHSEHCEELCEMRDEHHKTLRSSEDSHEKRVDKLTLTHRRSVDSLSREHEGEIECLKKEIRVASELHESAKREIVDLKESHKEKEIEMSDNFNRKLVIGHMWSKWVLLIAKQSVEEKICEGMESEFHSATDLLRIEHNSVMEDVRIQHEHNLLDMRKSYEQGIDVIKRHLCEANEKVSTLMTRMALVQGQLRDAERAVGHAKKSEAVVVAELKGKDAQIDAERRKAEAITRHLGEVQSRLLSWGLNVDGFAKGRDKSGSSSSKATPVESSTSNR